MFFVEFSQHFGGFIVLGYIQSVYFIIGDGYLFPSIAAVVLGGTVLAGGEGSLLGYDERGSCFIRFGFNTHFFSGRCQRTSDCFGSSTFSSNFALWQTESLKAIIFLSQVGLNSFSPLLFLIAYCKN